MSYNLLKVNEIEPIDGNIDVNIATLTGDSAENNQIIKKVGATWISTPAPTSAGTPTLLTQMYSLWPDGLPYVLTAFSLNTTYWAYSWSYRVVMQERIYNDVVPVNVSNPPSYLSSSQKWYDGVTLTAGTYFICIVPTQRTGAITWQLYHTPTSSLSGEYFGNQMYLNAGDGQTGTAMYAVLTITESRNVYARVKAGAGTYYDHIAQNGLYWNIRRLA